MTFSWQINDIAPLNCATTFPQLRFDDESTNLKTPTAPRAPEFTGMPHEDVNAQLQAFTDQIQHGHSHTALPLLLMYLREHRADQGVRAHTHYLIAWASWGVNDFATAQRHIRQALRWMDQHATLYLRALLMQAQIQLALDRFLPALDTQLQVLQLTDGEQDPDIVAQAYLGVGNYFQVQGKHDQALTCYEHAYDFALRSAEFEIELKAANYLLSLYCSECYTAEAEKILQDCWAKLYHRQEVDPAQKASLHHYQGMVLLQQQRFNAALEQLNISLQINQQFNFLWGQTQNRIQLAQLHASQQRYNTAIGQLETAVFTASLFDQGLLQQKICGHIRDIHVEAENYAAALAAQEAYHHFALRNEQLFVLKNQEKHQRQLRTLEHQLAQIKQRQLVRGLEQKIQRLEATLQAKATLDPVTQAYLPAQLAQVYPAQRLPACLLRINALGQLNEQVGPLRTDLLLQKLHHLLTHEVLAATQKIYRLPGFGFLLHPVGEGAWQQGLPESLQQALSPYPLSLTLQTVLFDTTHYTVEPLSTLWEWPASGGEDGTLA
ncbi:hypothetical protein [Chitinibacter tainanensis]|uniref:hypothetical protein n=1 Tax=Chitinibacter tainanensis TaxID=230667 RepID=UPI0012EC778B|nr:hypothetical protein [Chitinibacter tainanensis]